MSRVEITAIKSSRDLYDLKCLEDDKLIDTISIDEETYQDFLKSRKSIPDLKKFLETFGGAESEMIALIGRVDYVTLERLPLPVTGNLCFKIYQETNTLGEYGLSLMQDGRLVPDTYIDKIKEESITALRKEIEKIPRLGSSSLLHRLLMSWGHSGNYVSHQISLAQDALYEKQKVSLVPYDFKNKRAELLVKLYFFMMNYGALISSVSQKPKVNQTIQFHPMHLCALLMAEMLHRRITETIYGMWSPIDVRVLLEKVKEQKAHLQIAPQ
ncbi:MAG TPA: hypothetical protein VJK30_07260 [Coxiellaceae bacterium]|nr:MAG: hypothetical protein A3E81_08025 [Gammaproteobacteria bacterium RIFCSPHIGHO2_12_FULL_36_30]HLB57106.1 hypothetical protein [Coxiellaceae bacterium]